MEKYYVLERFALMKTAVISTLDSMMLKRKGIDKNQKNNNIKNARKLYKELESGVSKLKLLTAVYSLSAYIPHSFISASKKAILNSEYYRIIVFVPIQVPYTVFVHF